MHLVKPRSPYRLRINILHSILTATGNDPNQLQQVQGLFPPGLHCIRTSFPHKSWRLPGGFDGTYWSRWHVYDVIPDLNLAELFMLHWGSYEPKRGLYLQEIPEPRVTQECGPAFPPGVVYRWDGPDTLKRVGETEWNVRGGQVWLCCGFDRGTGK